MPSTISWRGDAVTVAQVDTVTVGGTIEADDVFLLTVGNKTLSVVGGSTDAATVAAAIVAAWNTLTQDVAPEFYEIEAADNEDGSFSLTAKTAGVPFTVTVSTTESGGGAADDQTFSLSHTTANSGPHDAGIAANYYGGVLPATGDTLVFENNSSSVLYGLDALAAVTLAKLSVKQSYTGEIGLPRINTSSVAYNEYRGQYLQVGATLAELGSGDGSGSGRLKIDFGSVQTACSVFNSGSGAESYVPAVLLLGTHASNVLSVLKGSVGVAYFAGEVSTVATLKIGYTTNVASDSDVRLGSGVTVATVLKAGGILHLESNVTNFTQYDGETTIGGAATIASAIVDGTLIDQSTGTITALTLRSKGVYDHARSLAAKTILALTAHAGAVYKDPYDVVTLIAGWVFSGCKPGDVVLDIAQNLNLVVDK